MKSILCRIGLHWPMRGHSYAFTDVVEGCGVYDAVCPCGREWLVNATAFPTFKVERKPTPSSDGGDK